LQKDGLSPAVVAEWLNDELGREHVYADSVRDKGWLKQLFSAAGQKPDFQLHHIEEIFDQAQTINKVCIVSTMRKITHRAAKDARQISEMIYNCLELPQKVCRP
jgi:hypothetical protein